MLRTARNEGPVWIAPDAADAARRVADEIEALTRRAEAPVLGLATGSTPLGVYRELARRAARGVDFGGLTTFNLDEYVGLAPDHPASFRAYVERHVVRPLGLDPTRVHLPPSDVDGSRADEAAAAYEQAIRAAGGIDLLLLGIGTNGHLAFNEPGSARDSRTRVVELAPETRAANARDFPPGEEVPRRAITMGIATILEARALRVLAFGAHKAPVVARALEGPVGAQTPASFVRGHPDLRILLDPAAAGLLRRS